MSQPLPAWDLLSDGQAEIESIEINEVTAEQEDQKAFNSYQQHPQRMRFYFGLLLFLSVLSLIFLSRFIFLAIVLFFAAVVYYSFVQNTAKRIIYAQIAHLQGWVYVSAKDPVRWRSLAAAFPQVFNRGTQNQYVDDQFWGATSVGGVSTNFWMANFTYTTGSGKNSTTTIEAVYAFSLAKKVQSDFLMVPRSFLEGGIGHVFSHEDIQTEWADFNKTFTIEYNGMRSVDGPNIFQTLNPIVQQKIMQLHAERGAFSLLFHEQTMIMVTRQQISPKYTNFFKNVAIDPRDVQEIEATLQRTIALAGDISPYIN